MASTEPCRTTMTTRSRKVQPELKARAEDFLAKANVSRSSSSKNAEGLPSRKRKLKEVGAAEKAESSKVPKRTESNPKRPATPSPPPEAQGLRSPVESDEKRVKRYRKQAPHSYWQKLQRAQTQRYACVDTGDWIC
jgi:hypothetical protein